MRYIVTAPVPNGYNWFNVADTNNREHYPNFSVFRISAKEPGAEDLCTTFARLSNQHARQGAREREKKRG